MAGRTDTMIRGSSARWPQAAEELEFERAARLRDDLGALRRAMEKQAVVLGDGTDADVVAFAEDELEAAVQVFHVRGGRVRGQRGWIVDKVEEVTTGELVDQFCAQVYGDGRSSRACPARCSCPELPDDAEALAELLSERRGSRVIAAGAAARRQAGLMETVERNAARGVLPGTSCVGPATSPPARKALAEMQEALDLPDAPLRIECFDVSHVQGTDVVASMVVFEDGLARKSEYRRFSVAERHRRHRRDGRGDAAPVRPLSCEEPGRRAGSGRTDWQTGADRPSRAASSPTRRSLVVVDGGAAAGGAAAAVLAELGIVDVALCGLAKRLEEVWLPDDDFPVILPRTSEALYLLQRVRDEAHRFAITFHRQKRSKRMTESALDDVPGLGEARRKALLAQFGSLRTCARPPSRRSPGARHRTGAGRTGDRAGAGALDRSRR